jgi:hypothetical protein
MLFIILGVIIALVCYIKGLSWNDWTVDIPLGFLFTLLGGAIGALIALLVSISVWGAEPAVDYTLVNTQEIYALEDNIVSSHTHYISSGLKDGEAAYFYIVDDEWGRQVLSKNTDNSFIKYDSEGSPRVETYEAKYHNPVIRALSLLEPSDRYRFVIPEGTMTEDISIDLK